VKACEFLKYIYEKITRLTKTSLSGLHQVVVLPKMSRKNSFITFWAKFAKQVRKWAVYNYSTELKTEQTDNRQTATYLRPPSLTCNYDAGVQVLLRWVCDTWHQEIKQFYLCANTGIPLYIPENQLCGEAVAALAAWYSRRSQGWAGLDNYKRE